MGAQESAMLFAGMIGPIPRPEASSQPEAAPATVVEKEKPSLGDLNPLIHFPDLARRESIEALVRVALEKIKKYGGTLPARLESTLVCSVRYPTAIPQLRFVTRFEIDHLTEHQISLLEELVKYTYSVKVRTRVSSDGQDIEPENYPPMTPGEMNRSKTAGWYMGANQDPTDSLHTGLFLYKDLGEVRKGNFLEEGAQAKYIVEVREAGMYQTDLVAFAIQVASILGQEKLLDPGELLYEVYYDLLRLGLKNVDDRSVYGMGDVTAQINRGLLYPLANPEIAKGLGQHPESVLMIGVPGTGKTLAVEELLQQDTGVLIIPIDPLELLKEMSKDKDKQTLLPRISEVSRRTGRRVILHIDDIEILAGNDNTYSTLLNLLAGVRESGFYVIASTNEPEKIPAALMQPQRFGILIYCGLQSEQVRYEILKIHAQELSATLGVSLFNSERERDLVLSTLAAHTEYFSPRYLWEIVNTAKSFLLERIVTDLSRTTGLTEADLSGYTFRVEDFEKAFSYVASVCDRHGLKERDEELHNFVRRSGNGRFGFSRNDAVLGNPFDSLRQQLS